MDTIFVSIASYRDPLCSTTLSDMYKNAEYPNRVYTGICQQNNKKDKYCVPTKFKYKNNVRMIELDYKEAKGPTWARYLCSTLYNGETYFMQIDSHTLFAKDWDSKIIQMITNLKNNVQNQKVIISHYPPNYDDRGRTNKVTSIPKCNVKPSGIISLNGAYYRNKEKLPTRNAFVTGGFVFTTGNWLQEVPFDPSLDYLFIGEEILLSARSYTKGWDVYTPNDNIVYHKYTRKDDDKIWDDVKYSSKQAEMKTKLLLKLNNDTHKLKDKTMSLNLEKYGLGTTRTLQEFYDFIGYDTKKKKCKNPAIEFYTPPQKKSRTPLIAICIITSFLIIAVVIYAIYHMYYKS